MPVSSTLDLYTTMFGWYMYDALWSVLAGTGLIILPFVVALAQTLISNAENENMSTKQYVRNIEVRMYSMLFVMVVCAMPTMILYPENMVYKQLSCEPDPGNRIDAIDKTVDEKLFDDTGTSATIASNKFMSTINNSEVKMPFWWYFFMSLSNAFTHTLMQELPCNPDFRTLSHGLSNTQIHDLKLREELQQFQDDCWKKSVRQYLQNIKDPNYSVPAALKFNIDEHISWIGSRLFLEQGGYYDLYRSTTPQDGYFHRAINDSPVTSRELSGDRWIPMCDEWWSDLYHNYDTQGLRERTLEYIKDQDDYSRWGSWFDYWVDTAWSGTTARTKDDYLLQIALKNDAEITNSLMRSYENHTLTEGALDGLGNLLANAGIAFKSIGNRAEANTYRSAAPLIQALIIMLFVMFLPLMMAAGLFDFAKVVVMTMVVFSVIFWSYLFELAEYIDNHLLSMLIAGNDVNSNLKALATSAPDVGASILVNAANDQGLATSVFAWIARMAYILLPAIFSLFMSYAGIRVVSSIAGGITNMGGDAARSGAAGPNMTMGLAKKAITKGR